MEKVLQVKNLSVHIGKELVHNIFFELGAEERLGIFGQSGSGKSVTMYAILDLLDKKAKIDGEILIQNTDVRKLDVLERRKFLGENISIIFQDSINALNPYEKIKTQMRRTITLHHQLKGIAADNFAAEKLKEIGLDAKRVLESYPGQLSGGMRQRVFIALSLCTDPKIIVADEPTTSLDTISQMRFIRLIADISKKHSLPLIFISHNLGLIAKLCENVLVMSDGEIIEHGQVSKIFQNPAHPVTREIVQETKKLYEEV